MQLDERHRQGTRRRGAAEKCAQVRRSRSSASSNCRRLQKFSEINSIIASFSFSRSLSLVSFRSVWVEKICSRFSGDEASSGQFLLFLHLSLGSRANKANVQHHVRPPLVLLAHSARFVCPEQSGDTRNCNQIKIEMSEASVRLSD